MIILATALAAALIGFGFGLHAGLVRLAAARRERAWMRDLDRADRVPWMGQGSRP